MIAFVFPGQGSQQAGMGKGLFDEIREYAEIERDVDAMLGYSMRKLCLENPEGRLKLTQYTQPSLYVVGALHYYKSLYEGIRPAYLAGHSLGEYNALLAAGVFDFLTGLELVHKRGQLMAKAKDGGMAAVIGLRHEEIARALVEYGYNGVDIANFNSPTQTVLSGPVADISRLGPQLEKAGAQLFVTLPVSAAFHSRYVSNAASEFADFIASVPFRDPTLPVVANVTAQPYPMQNAANTIKAMLVRQITSPVQWTLSIRYLLSKGVTEFREVGPGNVLTRLIQQIRQSAGG